MSLKDTFKFYHKDHKNIIYTYRKLNDTDSVVSWERHSDFKDGEQKYLVSEVIRAIAEGRWVVLPSEPTQPYFIIRYSNSDAFSVTVTPCNETSVNTVQKSAGGCLFYNVLIDHAIRLIDSGVWIVTEGDNSWLYKNVFKTVKVAPTFDYVEHNGNSSISREKFVHAYNASRTALSAEYITDAVNKTSGRLSVSIAGAIASYEVYYIDTVYKASDLIRLKNIIDACVAIDGATYE